MSAECSAEITHKALFSTTISELNKYGRAWSFEQELSKLFQLPTTWHSIVLLDEADVFLESRKDDPGAVNRNSLVAIFLRHLEYFSGIVFLTTNRIQVFDAAMKSRVHLALSYDEPDMSARRRIWAYNLDRIVVKGDDIDEALE